MKKLKFSGIIFLTSLLFTVVSCKKDEITPNILTQDIQNQTDSTSKILGKISSLLCDNSLLIGQVIVNQEVVNTQLHVQYTGGNGYDYLSQEYSSKGVEGLTLYLSKGYFSTQRVGVLKFVVKGKPSQIGKAVFSIEVGGQTCEVVIEVNGTNVPQYGYGPNFIDVDGNVYKSIYIGHQLWQAENLRTTKFNDGTPIQEIEGQSDWFKNFSSNTTSPMMSVYNNDHTLVNKNGLLYNWYVVDSSINGARNVCPQGWHVPTDQEWSVLEDYLGGREYAGGKLKEEGTNNWVIPNNSASNSTLFSALPSGYRLYNGNYSYIGNYGFYWTSTENGISHAYFRYLYNENARVIKNSIYKSSGFSIRCLKD